MTIGRGIIHIDDYYKFGKLLDSLAKVSYSIQYIPHKSELIITAHKLRAEEILGMLEGFETEVKYKGGLVFIRARW